MNPFHIVLVVIFLAVVVVIIVDILDSTPVETDEMLYWLGGVYTFVNGLHQIALS